MEDEHRSLTVFTCRSSAFPPTALIHGLADSGITYEDSEAIYNTLRAFGVSTEIALVPGAEHGFDVGAVNDVGL